MKLHVVKCFQLISAAGYLDVLRYSNFELLQVVVINF